MAELATPVAKSEKTTWVILAVFIALIGMFILGAWIGTEVERNSFDLSTNPSVNLLQAQLEIATDTSWEGCETEPENWVELKVARQSAAAMILSYNGIPREDRVLSIIGEMEDLQTITERLLYICDKYVLYD